MKSDEAIKTDMYEYINGSQLQTAVNGVLRKTRRPENSNKEDIIISILANENGQIQTATVNVNIYVPNKIVDELYSEEDTKRCDELSQLACLLFEVFRGDDYRARLISQRVYEIDGSDECVINNKIEYKQVNE